MDHHRHKAYLEVSKRQLTVLLSHLLVQSIYDQKAL